MHNICPYDADAWKQEFTSSEIYQRLSTRYDRVLFEKFIEEQWKATPTPRHRLSTSVVSATPWYYLNFLRKDTTIYDLGCGCNFFKPYFPHLIGVSPEKESAFFGDVHDLVDEGFFAGHREFFDSVFSINSLHFRPLEDLPNLLINFAAMLKKNGRGFLALNAARMLELSDIWTGCPAPQLSSWISDQFDLVPCKILVLDVDLSCMDAYLDGNIRVVFENE